MPDAIIPSLESVGLHVVPGYRIDPATGQEDPSWRHDPDPTRGWFAWAEAAKSHRVAVQERCFVDDAFRADVDFLCSRDPAYFSLLWLEVEEPRAIEAAGDEPIEMDDDGLLDLDDLDDYLTIHPFIPFAYQVTAQQTITSVVLGKRLRARRHNVLWDKARGCGSTYANLAAFYWMWLFRKGIRGTILTEKWDKADRAHSLNTLFGKLDLFFQSTPPWLIPEGFKTKGEKEAHRQKGIFVNPRTSSQINSEPTTASSTRSSREAYIAIDECAFQEYLNELWATALGTTLHVFGWSTASYQEGQQWSDKLRAGRKATSNTARVITIDWFEQPAQDARWYAETKAQFEEAGISEQFEVEYLRNADAGYGTLVYQNQVLHCPDTDAWYDASRPLFVSVDPGVEDETAWDFWQTHFPEGKKVIRWLDSYEKAKLPVEFHANVLTGIEPRPGDETYTYLEQGYFGEEERYIMRWMRAVHPSRLTVYGDPSVRRRDVTHESFVSVLQKESLRLREREFGTGDPRAVPITINLPWDILYRRNNFQDRRTGMRKALMLSEFSRTDGAQSLKHACAMTRFQEKTEKNTRPPGHIHDRFSHRVSAAEFGMIWEMLEITPQDLKAPKIEKPKSLHRGRRAHSPYQRQTKSVMGVA